MTVHSLRFLFVVLIAMLLAGCKPAPKSEPSMAASNSVPPAPSNPPNPPAPGTNAVENDDAMPEQDKLWSKLTELLSPPAYPEAWQEQAPTPEVLTEWNHQQAERALKAADLAHQYYMKFPNDERSVGVREQEYQQLNQAFLLGETNVEKRLEEIETARLQDANEVENVKLHLRTQQLQRLVQMRRKEGIEVALEQMEQGVHKLAEDFPGRPEVGNLLLTVARGWLENGHATRSEELVREILKGNPQGDVKELAMNLQRQLDRLGRPLELHFTAMDGKEVDLAKMRGDVVLINFWATWCAPCMADIPELRQLYEDFHQKGFQIVGINFDQDRQKVEQIVDQEKLVWPHYFEEDKTGNRFGREFQINGIPTMWLVDREGHLNDLNARPGLRGKIEKLLAK